MPVPKQMLNLAKKIVGPAGRRWVRRTFDKKLPNRALYRLQLTNRRGLEVGGPSELFSEEGPLPIYSVLKKLDNCLYSSQTLWAGQTVDGVGQFRHRALKEAGNQYTCEATDLRFVKDATYECVLASHCLEHVANPLLALSEWRRILAPQGLLLLVLPHKEGTFDWRRPTTKLAHLVEDFDNGVGEDDMTHLPEILALHDLERDKAAGSSEQFRERCQENHRHRAMHHHVFDSATVAALIDHAGFELIRVDTFMPYHIVALCRRSEGKPDNTSFLAGTDDYLSKSCFMTDRNRKSF